MCLNFWLVLCIMSQIFLQLMSGVHWLMIMKCHHLNWIIGIGLWQYNLINEDNRTDVIQYLTVTQDQSNIIQRCWRTDFNTKWVYMYTHLTSGGKSTQLLYLSKSIDTLIESYSSKSESHPVKYLNKSQSIWF